MRASILLASLALVAAGCESAPAPRAPSAPKVAPAKPEPAAEAKPEGEVAVEYSYSPIGKRDPFRSFLEDQRPSDTSIVEANCGPLCTWELDQLRVVAVVSGQASPVAMVEDPQGNGHLVRRGTAVGKRSGKVTDIRRDRLVVTELLRTPQGQVLPAKTEMPLKAKGQQKEIEIVDLSAQD
ncbi:pilus assembly protein PilP [Vulgatibacter incomptus]|uniref:Type IV pilus biogenesis protein PilP n=1 Tax=Vulgatibacter incomptus TaxID=1391653 RepID=A0A0K1PA82_9BACT|nr:pilus assembly protein PilP [Vulgatibacter incomptus]AKU90321.1 Type IV pilus biogenesis protein PilP [Vulgatibacter incomptus]